MTGQNGHLSERLFYDSERSDVLSRLTPLFNAHTFALTAEKNYRFLRVIGC